MGVHKRGGPADVVTAMAVGCAWLHRDCLVKRRRAASVVPVSSTHDVAVQGRKPAPGAKKPVQTSADPSLTLACTGGASLFVRSTRLNAEACMQHSNKILAGSTDLRREKQPNDNPRCIGCTSWEDMHYACRLRLAPIRVDLSHRARGKG
jgi:hypothetical protein